MTAYVLNSSGDWNNPLIWTPNGVPGETDTFTAGVFALTIPESYTAKIAGFVMGGTSTSARSRLLPKNNSKLELYGDCSSTNFMNIEVQGNFELDTRGYKLELGTSTVGAVTKVASDGTGIWKNWSSTIAGYFGRPPAMQKSGDLDVNGLLCVNISFRYGGNFYAGNNYIIRNAIFYNCVYVDCYDYIHPTADWILQNVDFRGSQAVSGSNVYLQARHSSGTITGERLFKDVTFDYQGSARTKITLRYFNQAFDFDGFYAVGTECELLDCGTATLKKFFSAKRGIVGSFSGDLTRSYITPDLGNPHTLENFIAKTFSTSAVEAIYPLTPTDAGDHLICKTGAADVLTTNCLFIDTRGGVLYNALKANTIGKFVLKNCTYIGDVEADDYGQLARNESGSIFMPESDLRVHSNICYVRSNPSGAASIRIINFDTPADDQIKYLDYNCYWGHGSNVASKFHNMTSATKTYGDDGWGMHDLHDVDPMFVDEWRGIVAWGALFGWADYDETVAGILTSVNGFDEATLTQAGNVPGRSVTDLLDWVNAGFVPQNPVIANAAMDGSTIGAFEYVAPSFSVIPNPIDLSISLSSPTLTESFAVIVDDVLLSADLSASAITPSYLMLPSDLTLATQFAEPLLSQENIIEPAHLALSVALGAAFLSVSYQLQPSDWAIQTSLQAAGIVASGGVEVVADDMSVGALLTAISLITDYSIQPFNMSAAAVFTSPYINNGTGPIKASILVSVVPQTLLVEVLQ